MNRIISGQVYFNRYSSLHRSKFVSSTGIPQGFNSSKEQKELYSALSMDPLRLKADVFLYGVAHVHHLASEVRITLHM